MSNLFLAMLLFLMGIRVGKSVLLQFNPNLEFLFIFLGLSTLLLIGPLLYWYVFSLTDSAFNFQRRNYLQIIPFLFVLSISPFISEAWFIANGRHWAFILLIGIYSHLALYITVSLVKVGSYGKSLLKNNTESRQRIFTWLRYVLIGISFIWISYVLNIFENRVPYILGPLIYSSLIYTLTFIGCKLRVLKLEAKPMDSNSTEWHIYREILAVLEKDALYISSDVSLQKLAAITGFNTHLISATINSCAQMNFNNLINSYRVEKAKEILETKEASKYTISSVAYDTGFNSLSSFNAAFKKFAKTTPSKNRHAAN